MSNSRPESSGQEPVDGPAARAEFDRVVARSRADLFGFCFNLIGSLADAEDLIQETLAHALFRLELYREGLSMRGWLFSIARNKSIDFLRRRQRQRTDSLEDAFVEPQDASEPLLSEVAEAVHRAVVVLPPRQRACVLLKEVLGFSLREIAETIGASEEATRSALARARRNLRSRQEETLPFSDNSKPKIALMERYVSMFNSKDWDGLTRLLRDDARCDVPMRFTGEGRNAFTSRYFNQYSMRNDDWRMSVARFDGDAHIVSWTRGEDDQWVPCGLIRLLTEEDAVSAVTDYTHVGYMRPFLREKLRGVQP